MYYNDQTHTHTFNPVKCTLTHNGFTLTTNNDYYRNGTSLYYGKIYDEHDGLNDNHTTVNKQNKTIIIPYTEKL